MPKTLTDSLIERQNILNNPFAVKKIQSHLKISGITIDDKLWITTQQAADFFETDISTIKRYLDKNDKELRQNGYKLFTGKDLEIAKKHFASGTDELTKTTVLGMFDFRSFLNLGMLLTHSDNAKNLRLFLLDTAIEVMNEKYGYNRKYINQQHPDYEFAIKGYNFFHEKLRKTLQLCVEMSQTKYIYFTNKIYQFLFLEKSKEYRVLLALKSKEKSAHTHYPEVITLIASFETDFAEEIRSLSKSKDRKLEQGEVEEIFELLIVKERWMPLLQFSRQILASRDNAFRGVNHNNLETYKQPISTQDYLMFAKTMNGNNPLTEEEKQEFQQIQSQSLFYEIEANENVYKRLKNR
jgi:hypothetical protein